MKEQITQNKESIVNNEEYIQHIEEEILKLKPKPVRRILHGNHGHGAEPYNSQSMTKEEV